MKKSVFLRIAALLVAVCMALSACSIIGKNNDGNESSSTLTDPVTSGAPTDTRPDSETEPVPDPFEDIAMALGSSSISKSAYEAILNYAWAEMSMMFSLFGILSDDDLTEDKMLSEVTVPEEFAEALQFFGIEDGQSLLSFIHQLAANELLKPMLAAAEAARREGIEIDRDAIDEIISKADEEAKAEGYSGIEEMVKELFSGSITLDELNGFIEVIWLYSEYENFLGDHKFSDDEISEYVNDEENSFYFGSPTYTVIRGEKAAALRELVSEMEPGEADEAVNNYIGSLSEGEVSVVDMIDLSDPDLLLTIDLGFSGSYAFGTENGEDVFVMVSEENENRDSKSLTYYLIYSEADPTDLVSELEKLSFNDAVEYIEKIISETSSVYDDSETDVEADGEPDDASEEDDEDESDNTVMAMKSESMPDWHEPTFAVWLTDDGRQPGDIAFKKVGSSYTVVYFVSASDSYASQFMISEYVSRQITELVEAAEYVIADGLDKIDIPAKSAILDLIGDIM